jgi:DNA repair exonuclease SbcCD nuclease subunit
MKGVVIADLHIKNYRDTHYENYNGTLIPLKVKEILNAVKQVCDYATENKIDNVFILGDVNDLKINVQYPGFVLFKQLLNAYEHLKFYIISGNHDEATKDDGGVSSIQLLDSTNVITIVNDTYVLDDITLIPWSSNIPELIQLSKPNKVLMSHLGLSEGLFNSGLSIKTNVGVKDLKKFEYVFLGHYHLPQSIGHVTYVGSPIQLNRGESGDEKRFLVFDTEEDSCGIKSIPITGYRKYINIIVDDTNKDTINSDVNKLLEENHHITVRVDKNTELTDLNENVKVIIQQDEEDFLNRGINTTMSIKEQCEKYLEIKEIPEKNRNAYIKILDEVRNTVTETE